MPFEGWVLPTDFPPPQVRPVRLVEDHGPPLKVNPLSPEALIHLTHHLRKAHGNTLSGLGVERIIRAVDLVARRFLDPKDLLRAQALAYLGPHAGFSEPMARTVLEGMAVDWTRPRLEALLGAEFPDPTVLDGFSLSSAGGKIRASGYPLTFHLGAGTVPGVGTTSLIRALLVKSAVLLKPGRGDVVLPTLFARGVREADPELGRGVAVLYWPSSEEEKTEAVLREADLVVVYGGDDTVRWIRDRTPLTTPLRAYRHRMGVGLVGRDALEDGDTARDAARAVALFDQRGCVSPHLFLVEEDEGSGAEEWARMLAAELEGLEGELPSGTLPAEEGAAIQQVRGEGEMEEALGKGFIRHGGSQAPWTVLFHPRGSVTPSCLNRTVRVIPVRDISEAVSLLEAWAPHLQTVGVAGLGESEGEVVEKLVKLGVSRIAPLKHVPWPPPWWHHDGEGPLRTLVRWTDLETG